MKQALWQFLLVTLAVLYSLVISIHNSQAIVDQTALSKNTSSENHYFSSSVSSTPFYHTIQTVNYLAVGSNLPFTPLKNPFHGFLTFAQAIEGLYFRIFSYYSFYAQNLLIRVKQTDLIFPFHYFW